jgi:hypothetical protein
MKRKRHGCSHSQRRERAHETGVRYHRWMARRAHKESGCGADKHWHSTQVRRAEQGVRREVGSRCAWTREPGRRRTVQAHRLHGSGTSEHVCEGTGRCDSVRLGLSQCETRETDLTNRA